MIIVHEGLPRHSTRPHVNEVDPLAFVETRLIVIVVYGDGESKLPEARIGNIAPQVCFVIGLDLEDLISQIN